MCVSAFVMRKNTERFMRIVNPDTQYIRITNPNGQTGVQSLTFLIRGMLNFEPSSLYIESVSWIASFLAMTSVYVVIASLRSNPEKCSKLPVLLNL